ncbi:3-oxoacyl-ACP synthase III family protein [Candidatus Gracilibacteria bacterium]|nr:3-oxoacyl-ACP synthase III family protein [Candidatus Gracilibacteria bacterium]
MKIISRILGTGSYIPDNEIPNSAFLDNKFYDSDGNLFPQKNEEIIQKFLDITGIKSRRYTSANYVASHLGFFAAQKALKSSDIDPESLDYIIVAHNFGDVKYDNRKSDFVPSLAARIKANLGIKNPKCIAYDLPFGCPGWLQGIIFADYLIRSGDAKRILVIGTETLSRVCDPHDRDSMIYSDGSGATILEALETDKSIGILSHAMRSDTINHSKLLWMGSSYDPNYFGDELFLKMNGNALYKYALRYVPVVVKEALDKSELQLSDVSKLLIHQANEKMDNAILEGVCKLYGVKEIPWHIMPMTIHEFGNSSVATVPTLLDLIFKGELNGHVFESGNILVFASVGAGMNINSVVYRVP